MIPLTEKYRPKILDDLVMLPDQKKLFENMINNNSPLNLLFIGSAGLGKTSLAKLLGKMLDKEILYINASLESNIDTIRNKVSGFAYTESIFGGNGKLCILDESERLGTGNSAAQDALKVILEETPNTQFIFITNNPAKIIAPLKSRLQTVEFGVSEKDKVELMKLYYQRLKYILDTESITYNELTLKFLIKKIFPDFRKVINECQKYSIKYGKIDEEVLTEIDYNTQFKNLVLEMKSKNFDGIINICKNLDANLFFNLGYEKIEKMIDNSSKPELIAVLNNYDFQNNSVVNPVINLIACCWEIAKKVKFL